MTCPRLIEVALPIREISAESVRDKSLRHGHISTLHLWWARRPLAASRAVVFASLVPDPGDPQCPSAFRDAVVRLLKNNVPHILQGYRRGHHVKNDPDPYKPYEGMPDTPRNRLLTFIAKWSPEWIAFEKGENGTQPKPAEMLDDRCLVKWETSDPENEQGQAVLKIARELIAIAHSHTPIPPHAHTPVLLDPFAGGGAIPLEAARRGCQAIANDYNPVAYLILRATCEFPQKYGKPPRREERQVQEETLRPWRLGGEKEISNRLAHDVEQWARWILERARERIGHLYPAGKDGKPVVGYLWARTAPCSNPACRAEIPLLRSLLVCNKPGKRVALTMAVRGKEVTFGIAKVGQVGNLPYDGTMLNRGDCRCPICQQTTPVADLRRAGLEGKMGERMVAVIIDTPQGKDYRPVEPSDLAAFEEAKRLAETVERPSEYIVPEINAPNAPPDAGAHRSISVDIYGFKTFGSLFNPRQLLAMQTFVACLRDALELLNHKGHKEHEENLSDLRVLRDYSKAVAVYLGLWVSKVAPRLTTVGRWHLSGEKLETPFDAQAVPMKWDFPEVNPFED